MTQRLTKNNVNSFELLTGRSEKHLEELNGFKLHIDAVSSFNNLQKLALQEIGSDLQLISSFRNFERQKIIWNAKSNGERAVYDENNNILEKEDFSSEAFIEKIMRFSAIPGASRHHWGTDIDIFDANELERKNVSLVQSECIDSGPFSKLHTWLDEKIHSGESYGFYRPYNQDLGGVSPEKWHISYRTMSSQFFEQYTIDVFIKNLEMSGMEYKDILLTNPEHYFKKYIQNINLD